MMMMMMMMMMMKSAGAHTITETTGMLLQYMTVNGTQACRKLGMRDDSAARTGAVDRDGELAVACAGSMPKTV